MSEGKRGLDIIDYFLIILKWKKFLSFMAVIIFIISYLCIYFFIKPQYDSTALLIPTKQEQLGGFSSLLKNFGNLPIGLGNFGESSSMDRFKTIIYSRTNLDEIINKFNLCEDYDLKSVEKAEKELSNNITTEVTKEDAFTITVRAITPIKSSEMVNFIVDKLNTTYVDLNVRKSKDNRIFLESRYNEIKENLRIAEDSLKDYQKKSGVFLAEDQIKATIEEYAKLDANLAQKQIELKVIERMYGKNSPQLNSQKISVEEYSKKINDLKLNNDNTTLLLPLNSLPNKAIIYLRLYRDVKIYESMLEFIIPLYEQAKFEEQKGIPILQVIDYGVPSEKKSYPPRVLFSLIITFILLLLIFFVLIIKEIFKSSTNPKMNMIKDELRLFNNKKLFK
ncbi:MAG: hypothetical protein CO128_01425 [Ignavibacteriales bacterium CG_4_9_14_3_um_filter_30_11]|nr:MAG: hypothetical protein CO128_01425 [Ignavibacteriales bacterium CG_4_9_14_3_um_filter_30_11]